MSTLIIFFSPPSLENDERLKVRKIMKRDIMPFCSDDVSISMRTSSLQWYWSWGLKARKSNKFLHLSALLFQLLCHDPAPYQTILIASLFGSMENISRNKLASISLRKFQFQFTIKEISIWVEQKQKVQFYKFWIELAIIRLVDLSFLQHFVIVIETSTPEKIIKRSWAVAHPRCVKNCVHLKFN